MVYPMVEAKKPRPKKAQGATKKAPAKKAAEIAKQRTGRPIGATKLDAARSQELLNAIRLGSPLQLACDFAGISRETLRKWRLRGEKALLVPPGDRSPTERNFVAFVGALGKAVAQAGVQAQRTVHSLMSQELKEKTPEQQRIALTAATFFLTHRLSDYYTTKTSTELTGKNGGPLDVALSADRAWEILQAINKGEPIVASEEDAGED